MPIVLVVFVRSIVLIVVVQSFFYLLNLFAGKTSRGASVPLHGCPLKVLLDQQRGGNKNIFNESIKPGCSPENLHCPR